jgi:hypothetical protein
MVFAQDVGANKVGTHWRGSGLVEQVAGAGEKVERVDSFGHAVSGFATKNSIYQFNEGLAKQLAPHLTADAKVVIHGCGPTRNTEAFVRALGPGRTLYTHDIKSGPGMPINWERHSIETDAAGQQNYVRHKLSGDDRVVGEILSESYVKWWASKQTSSSLERFLTDPKKEGFNITNDVRGIMQTELDQRSAGGQPGSQGQSPPVPQECQNCSRGGE